MNTSKPIATRCMRAAGMALVCAASVWSPLAYAVTFHRSFKNGYPAEWNVSKEEANDTFTVKRGSVTYSNGKGRVVAQSSVHELQGRVTRVLDGDRIVVTDRAGGHRVRLFQIDAPELEQAYGREAAAYLFKSIGGKLVRVEWTAQDTSGWILGTVYLDDEEINLRMVADGCAWHDRRTGPAPHYSSAEKKAQEAKAGLWANPAAVNPMNFRRAQRKK